MEKDAIYTGNMDVRVTVFKKNKTKTETGSVDHINVDVATVWAERKTESSTKVLDEKVVALNMVSYRMHFHPAIKAEKIQDLFVSDNGLELEVYGVDFVGRKKYMILKCQDRE